MEGIREIMNISKKGSNNIDCIQIGKNTITNSSDIANEFNRYFTSIAKQIEEKLIRERTLSMKEGGPEGFTNFFKKIS